MQHRWVDELSLNRIQKGHLHQNRIRLITSPSLLLQYRKWWMPGWMHPCHSCAVKVAVLHESARLEAVDANPGRVGPWTRSRRGWVAVSMGSVDAELARMGHEHRVAKIQAAHAKITWTGRSTGMAPLRGRWWSGGWRGAR